MAGLIRQRGKQSWEVRALAGNDADTGRKRYINRTVRGERRDAERSRGRQAHHLRHFSGTQLDSAGIDVRTVSGRLGHANASTTLDFYAQFLQASDERAADALGELLRPPA